MIANEITLPHDDHFADQLAEAIHFVLFEPWRDVDAWITRFCPCSLTLSGACSLKRSRARRSRSQSCRRTTHGKSADPDGPSSPEALNLLLSLERARKRAPIADGCLRGPVE